MVALSDIAALCPQQDQHHVAEFIIIAALLHGADMIEPNLQHLQATDFRQPLRRHIARCAVADVHSYGMAMPGKIKALAYRLHLPAEALATTMRIAESIAPALTDSLVRWALRQFAADRKARQ